MSRSRPVRSDHHVILVLGEAGDSDRADCPQRPQLDPEATAVIGVVAGGKPISPGYRITLQRELAPDPVGRLSLYSRYTAEILLPRATSQLCNLQNGPQFLLNPI